MAASNFIVAGVDGSDASNTAIRWAARRAARDGNALHLLTGYTVSRLVPGAWVDKVLSAVRSAAEDNLAAARRVALDAAPGVELVTGMEPVNPIQLLLEASRRAAMVVVGSEGLTRLAAGRLGSISAAVVSHAHCPVVVLRTGCRVDESAAGGTVVAGTDGSEASTAALRAAFEEARSSGAQLTVVNSWMDPQMLVAPVSLELTEEYEQAMHQAAEAMLDQQLPPLQAHYPTVRVHRVVSRTPARVTLPAQAENAQLLVVGSHGRGAFMGTVMGSTSRALLHSAPCPLMVVRPTAV